MSAGLLWLPWPLIRREAINGVWKYPIGSAREIRSTADIVWDLWEVFHIILSFVLIGEHFNLTSV